MAVIGTMVTINTSLTTLVNYSIKIHLLDKQLKLKIKQDNYNRQQIIICFIQLLITFVMCLVNGIMN
jgi:hypothetical protein